MLLSDEVGSIRSKYIIEIIYNIISDCIAGENCENMFIFSCHDTTLFALSAALGLNISLPYFASTIMIDLLLIDDEYYIGFQYCQHYDESININYKMWNEDEYFIEYDDAINDVFYIADFIDILQNSITRSK